MSAHIGSQAPFASQQTIGKLDAILVDIAVVKRRLSLLYHHTTDHVLPAKSDIGCDCLQELGMMA